MALAATADFRQLFFAKPPMSLAFPQPKPRLTARDPPISSLPWPPLLLFFSQTPRILCARARLLALFLFSRGRVVDGGFSHGCFCSFPRPRLAHARGHFG